MWYTLFKYLMFRPGVKIFLRPKLEGAQNIPKHGAVIMASNHIDAGDTFTLPALIHRRMVIGAKKELFQGTTFSRKVVAWFMKAVGMVPLDRSGGRASATALGPVEQALADGHLVGIFPEGTRSPDSRLYRGHTGMARMALEAQCPIIPVGMVNTHLVRNRIGIPTMKNARIVIGEPLDYSQWYGRADEVKVLRWVTNDVMAHIQQLSGQDYVDVYASRAKYGNLRGKDLSSFVKPTPLAELQAPPADQQRPKDAH